MSRFHISTFPELALPSLDQALPSELDRRYGVTLDDDPAVNGYHFAAAEHRLSDPNSVTSISRNVALALTGSTEPTAVDAMHPTSGASLNGVPVPPGGCIAVAFKAVYGYAEWQNPPEYDALPDQINTGSFKDSLSNPAVVAAFSRWSACMGQAGYHYPDPLTAIGSFSSTGPVTSIEISTALADVRCKETTGLITTWFNAEASTQRTLIAQDAAGLKQLSTQNAAVLANAKAVLTG